jgi:quercetin dioxygenase-like cupin family protein
VKVHKLKEMVRGWFVGDFEPNVIRTQGFEVGVKNFLAGETEPKHMHRVSTEITCVVSGRVRMFDQEFGPGDIVTAEPGDATSFEALTDGALTVVKVPSVLGDKYLVP